MTTSIEILASDRAILLGARPDVDGSDLASLLLERGRAIVERSIEERVPEDLPVEERIGRLRDLLARKAASVAVHRFEILAGRERALRAEEAERTTYEQHLELEKDVVPPLKLEAKALRAEIRTLEEEARRRGIDPDRIEPRIDWPNTLAVDAYERPQYETNESRRQAAVRFFRRTLRA
jgi:hypothetical protein